MKYGYVECVDTSDYIDGDLVSVSVGFMVDRSLLYEFMDCLKPIDKNAPREPIEAILEHSCGEAVER